MYNCCIVIKYVMKTRIGDDSMESPLIYKYFFADKITRNNKYENKS